MTLLTRISIASVIPFSGGLASLSFIFILLVAGLALVLAGFLIQTVLLCFPTTGWELLFLPLALGPGQLLVLAGLICTRRARA